LSFPTKRDCFGCGVSILGNDRLSIAFKFGIFFLATVKYGSLNTVKITISDLNTTWNKMEKNKI
jgi:hypothetical protein